ncbi:zinc ABC transporter substrate-binding protein [Marinobacter salinisoli]|uniref:High-affinity zinc uptake system protein ZnuA n=1 Tax=Marinobacter salinisoli TaxID=2769486 RepID=A0ABX7MMM7_9GAMM|nr:zinc ABC transporter substrate-binding protein [Marinobacter salinisoli]QSP93465.1 zinc ABC transporter substrate-binding protein [Marinobacter salinisoli]
MPQRNAFLLSAIMAFASLAIAPSHSAATEVVTSIKPLTLLVHAVAGDTVEITTLVPEGSSPHTYTMRPSQRRALESADAIFWVGPSMESFLTRLLDSEDFHGRVTALSTEEVGDDHHHGHHAEHGDGHHHEAGEDPHIWIDPALALEMAHTIRDTLANLEGMDSQRLDQNLADFEASLAETEADIQSRLAVLEGVSLFAYHDAFTRFAEHFDLDLQGVLTLNPALSPGARHIQEVQSKLEAAGNACILTEPQFNQQWWSSITDGLDVRFSSWDPLASDIEPGADGYEAFLAGIAEAAIHCLPKDAEHQGN